MEVPMFLRYGWMLWAAIATALVFVPKVVHGQDDFDKKVMVASGGNDRVVLEPKQCESKMVLDAVRPEYQKKMRKITYFMRGTPIPGCAFIDREQGAVFAMFEDGDQLTFPFHVFKPEGGGMNHQPGYRPDARSFDASLTVPTLVLGTRG